MTIYHVKINCVKKDPRIYIILLNFDSGQSFPESKIENAMTFINWYIFIIFLSVNNVKIIILINKYYLLTFVLFFSLAKKKLCSYLVLIVLSWYFESWSFISSDKKEK